MSTSAINDEVLKLSDCCVSGGIMAGTPTGKEMEPLTGTVKFYLAGEEFEGKSNGKVIVLIADVFGLGVPNPRLLADSISQTLKLPVYVPDLLEGDYPSPVGLRMIEEPIGQKPFLERTMKTISMMTSFMTNVGPRFLYRHRPSVLVALADTFCTALRTEKGAVRIGISGYCLGGSVVTLLGDAKYDSVDVIVCAHPGQLRADDFLKINKPICMILSQEDFTFDAIKKDALINLKKRELEGLAVQINTYDNTVHGFALRPAKNMAAFDESVKDTVAWYTEHL